MREDQQNRKLSVPPPSLGRQRVGRYEIVYPLAQGGMASVHVGRLSGMAGFERLVAIKVIHPHLSGQGDFVRMFLDEARLSARIHHPNVGEVIEVGEDQGLYYMVCELIVGQSLRDLARRSRQLGMNVPHAIWADIAAKVCQGLHEAHELRGAAGEPMNLVHRDVSPRNVLVSYNGFVKLIDFGIAWAKERITHTDAGSVKGKIGFMPPEQIRGEPLDRRGDLFSLGVVLYLLATGAHPFPGKSDAERMNKIVNGEYRPPRELCPSIDRALEKIIITALENDRDNRYATASQMGRELMAYVHASSDPPGSWDSSVEISALMHACFDEELADHREKIRSVVDDADAADRAFQSRPPGASGVHTVMTAAGTPHSLRQRVVPNRRRFLGAAAGGLIAAAAAVAVLVAVWSGGDPEPQPLPGDPGTATLPAPSEDPAPVEEPPVEARITLAVTPSDASVEVDGRLLEAGVTSFTLPRSDRRHTVTVRAAGFREATRELSATGDARLEISLEPLPSPPRPDPKKKAGGRKTGGNGKKGLDLVDSPYG
jgi:serine/threonine protein kinase